MHTSVIIFFDNHQSYIIKQYSSLILIIRSLICRMLCFYKIKLMRFSVMNISIALWPLSPPVSYLMLSCCCCSPFASSVLSSQSTSSPRNLAASTGSSHRERVDRSVGSSGQLKRWGVLCGKILNFGHLSVYFVGFILARYWSFLNPFMESLGFSVTS